MPSSSSSHKSRRHKSSTSLLSINRRHHSQVNSIKNKTEHRHHGNRKTINLLNVQKTLIATHDNCNSSSKNNKYSSRIVVQSKQLVLIQFLLYILKFYFNV